MENEKKYLDFSCDLAELFMAQYALIKTSEDDILFLNKNFKENMIKTLSNEKYADLLEQLNLLIETEDGLALDVNKFFKCFKTAKSRQYYNDEFTYDFEDDKIKTKINRKNVANVIATYDQDSIKLVSEMVNEFITLECKELKEQNKKLLFVMESED